MSAVALLLGLLLGVGAAAAAFAWFVGFHLVPPPPVNDPEATPRPVANRGELAADESATIALFKRCSPCVVNITTLQNDRFNMDPEGIPKGTGSGFLWDVDGHVVTNFHVIQGADRARITLSDNTPFEARLTGAAPEYDLAVLKIDARGKTLPGIELGRSNDLQVGQKVLAIGNPFGLDQTLTTGVISALGRQIRSLREQKIDGVIQTDAAINPGNSGGPLLDSAGRLIGVNTQIVSPSGAYAGIGFAIPVDTVNQVVPELIRNGKLIRPSIVGAQFAPPSMAQQLRVTRGVLIINVAPGTPADEAGLRPTRRVPGGFILGDIIAAVDGKPVNGSDDLLKLLATKKVGDSVVLTLKRGKDEVETTIELREG